MKKPKGTNDAALFTLMAEKTRLMTQAQALAEMGMEEASRPLWLEIAGHEERIAPLLDTLGREREAAIHRVSAASSYERADDYARAANLYWAALGGPLVEETRVEVKGMLVRCLTRLTSPATPAKPARAVRSRKSIATT